MPIAISSYIERTYIYVNLVESELRGNYLLSIAIILLCDSKTALLYLSISMHLLHVLYYFPLIHPLHSLLAAKKMV